MDDVEHNDDHTDEEIFDVEVVEPSVEDGVDALASLADKGPAEDALGDLAAGLGEVPPDAIAAAEARKQAQAEDALASLASGETIAQEPDDPDAPAGGDQDPDDPANQFAFAENEHIHVDPDRIRAGRQQQNRLADNAQSLSFKKTMTPLLLVVGVILLAISGITFALKGDPNAPGATDMDKYGMPMMLASLLLGLVLLAGAVLFHMEISRAKKSNNGQDN